VAFSRCNRRTSSSALACRPLSGNTSRTAAPGRCAYRRAHFRKRSGRTSNSRPTCARLTPSARRSASKRTASTLNSALNERRARLPLLELDFRHGSPPPQCYRGSNEVSIKSGSTPIPSRTRSRAPASDPSHPRPARGQGIPRRAGGRLVAANDGRARDHRAARPMSSKRAKCSCLMSRSDGADSRAGCLRRPI